MHIMLNDLQHWFQNNSTGKRNSTNNAGITIFPRVKETNLNSYFTEYTEVTINGSYT